MVDYPHKRFYTTRAFECNPLGYLRPSVIQRYVQEVATNHLDVLGLTHQSLMDEGVVFVMTSAATKIHTAPTFGQDIRIYTAPAPARGTRMYREVIICDEFDNLMIECQTCWVIVDPNTHHPIRPTAFKHSLPIIENYSPFCDPQKHNIGIVEQYWGERIVRATEIDRNQHLNNTVYIDIMLDCTGEKAITRNVDSIYIKYKGEAKLGQTLHLYVEQKENNVSVIGKIGDKPCFEGEVYFLREL